MEAGHVNVAAERTDTRQSSTTRGDHPRQPPSGEASPDIQLEADDDTGSDSGDRAPHSQESEMTEGERERESERESKVVTFWASPPLCE